MSFEYQRRSRYVDKSRSQRPTARPDNQRGGNQDSHFGSYKPMASRYRSGEVTAIVTSQPDRDQQLPSPISSAIRLGVAGALLQRGGWLDNKQNKLIGALNELQQAVGAEEITIVAPTDEAIMEQSNIIIEKYSEALSDPEHGSLDMLVDPTLVLQSVHEFVKQLYDNDFEGEEPNSAEKVLAIFLDNSAPDSKPATLRRMLQGHVQAPAQDMKTATNDAFLGLTLSGLQQRQKELLKIGNVEPRVLFPVDWLTSQVLVPRAKRNRFKNQLWGFGTDGIYIEGVDDDRDKLVIPYNQIVMPGILGDARNAQFQIEVDNPRYTDAIRKGFGRIGRPLADRLSGAGGAMINFQGLGDLARVVQERVIFVRDEKVFVSALQRIVNRVSTYNNAYKRVAELGIEQNPQIPTLIRPKVVERAMVDGTLLHFPGVWDQNGKRDFKAEEELAKEVLRKNPYFSAIYELRAFNNRINENDLDRGAKRFRDRLEQRIQDAVDDGHDAAAHALLKLLITRKQNLGIS